MDATVIGLVTIGVFGIFYVIFTWGNSGKKTGHSSVKNDSKKDVKKTNVKKVVDKKEESKKAATEIRRKDMLDFIEFDKISDDMILQDKETKYTMVIQCKGINYDLMSDIEQLAVEEGFITFLNTLKSPIQLYVQARAINLKTSLDMYKSKVDEINQKFTDSIDRVKTLSNNINTTSSELREASLQSEKFSNISEYAQDITKYVEKLSLNKHMLQRRFYVVISYYKSEVNSTAHFSASEIHDICYRELYTRAQSIIGGLQACTVSARVLSSNELAELLYISYNRDDEKLLDIKTALDSGFYRMYSTTKDIQEKKREAMEKQIQQEAMSRVEQAIKTAISNGIIKSKDQMVEEYESATDVAAVKILEDTNINEDDKKKIQQVIVDQHNRGVDERMKEREKSQVKEEIPSEITKEKEILEPEINVRNNKLNDDMLNVNSIKNNEIEINNVNVNSVENNKSSDNTSDDNSEQNDKTNKNTSSGSSFDDLIV